MIPPTPAARAAKLGLLGSLYFSQGLPYGFFIQALPVILLDKGLSLGAIGLSSLLAVPWALKFLWAPLVDRFYLPRVGRRRSWILPLQGLGVAVLAALALTADLDSLPLLMGAVFLLNLVAATQDIATDGLAVDVLAPEERGLANGLQVAGYRVGMIIGGGALLILYKSVGAAGVFWIMAGLTAAATLPVVFTREPGPRHPLRTPWGDDPAPPIPHFLRRRGALGVLALIMTYKFGDAFALGMLRPFMVQSGLDMADIGWILGTVGFVTGLLGALTGGGLVNTLGRRRALVTFGLLQALTVAGYTSLAFGAPTRIAFTVMAAAEHFAGGMATAALFTAMMDWCSDKTSATDYTVQASAVVIATLGASALAGYSAQWLGFQAHFVLSTALALGAVAVVRALWPAHAPTAAVAA